MKRDMDLIRELLLKIENGQTSFTLSPTEGGMTRHHGKPAFAAHAAALGLMPRRDKPPRG
jgi:hypothetical protein